MRRLFIYIMLLTVVFMPSVALAEMDPIVPCGTIDVETKTAVLENGQPKKDANGQIIYYTITGTPSAPIPDGIVDNPCDFDDFLRIINNLIMWLIMVGATIATLGFAYAGYLYITAAGSEEKIAHAHSIFYKTILGFAFMLGAWLIAYTFERTFLTEEAQRRSFLEER